MEVDINWGAAHLIEIDQKAHNEPHNQEKKRVNWFFFGWSDYAKATILLTFSTC